MKTHGLKFCELPLAPLLVLILLLASLQTASADPVSAERAKAAVRGWLRADQAPLQTTVGQKVKRVETFNDAKGIVLYHVVYLDPEGFVIVAADDLIEPIIGFAPRGHFDPSTGNPLGALVSNDLPGRHARVKGIKAAKAQGLPLAAKSKWERLNSMDPAGPGGVEPLGITTVSDVRVAPLTQTAWNQATVGGNACYNYYTPPYAAGTTSNYVCGCTATAMAQLMRFWQYPVSGVGTNSFPIWVDGVATNRNLRGGDGAGGPYDWGNMVLSPNGSSTLAQRQAIGALCADAGITVYTDYTQGSSGGGFPSPPLINTFGYANAINGYNPVATTDGVGGLYGMVNPNLDAGCPVLFAIWSASVGHSVVCDGYGYNLSTPYHHLNLGWSGMDTAWYNLPTVDAGNPPFTFISDCFYNIWTNGTGEIISGRITDSNSLPIAGVAVTATRSGGGSYTATSNTNGIYALKGIPSLSQYTLSANKTGYSFTNQIVTTGLSTNTIPVSGNRWAENFPPVPQDYSYTASNGTVTIIGYIGNGGAVTIPNTINGLTVTSIGDSAFYNCIFLTSVVIPNSVTNLGNYTFENCYSLANVTIGNGVTNIGTSAFSYCYGLTNITIGTNVTSIRTYAFLSCTNLTSVVIPDSVTNLGSYVFENCYSLANVTLGNGVTSIGSYAFYDCTNLTSVMIGTNVTNIGIWAFFGCSSLTNITIPNSVTSIGHDAFRNCTSLTSVTIPNNVTSIGDMEFYNCTNLTNVTIGTNVTSIGQLAFSFCTSLKSVKMPDSVTCIGIYAFYYCPSLTNVTIGTNVTSIGQLALSFCTSLKSVMIPASVTNIGSSAFSYCFSLMGVYFQGNAASLGSSVFDSDNNTTVYYLPGTTGWGSTFGGRPAVLWNPQFQVNDASFGVQTNRFGFNITGTTNIPIVLEACADLANPVWVSLQSCTLTNGLLYFGDPDWTNYPARFYRIRSP